MVTLDVLHRHHRRHQKNLSAEGGGLPKGRVEVPGLPQIKKTKEVVLLGTLMTICRVTLKASGSVCVSSTGATQLTR
jgi:hypothetical protein